MIEQFLNNSEFFEIIIFFGSIFFNATTIIISIINLIFAKKAHNIKPHAQTEKPKISVLIPARNEEKNIDNILSDLISQNYSNIEVIVLNDNSEDLTKEEALNFANKFSFIKVYDGEPLPEGWLGKNWSCWQLYLKSSGDILCFIDADVRINSKAIDYSFKLLQKYKIDFLSFFPTQQSKTFGESLVVPLMKWFLLSFLPLPLIYYSKLVAFSAANGQFIMLKRKVYEKIGGHLSVKNHPVEDMKLIKLSKQNNFKAITLPGDDKIFCRMYDSFATAFKGFEKNFYNGFEKNNVAFFIFLFSIVLFQIVPFAFLFFYKNFVIPILLSCIQKAIVSIISKRNLFIEILLHPVHMIIIILIGISSFYKSNFGKIEWKNRTYDANIFRS